MIETKASKYNLEERIVRFGEDVIRFCKIITQRYNLSTNYFSIDSIGDQHRCKLLRS